MNELLELLRASIEGIKTRANVALAGMPPIDQFQGATQVVGMINTMEWIEKDVKNLAEHFAGAEAKLAAALEKSAADKIAASLAAGEIVKKTDADAAITAAELRVKGEVEGSYAAEKAKAALAATRRGEIVTLHGADAAAALAEDVLAVEDFDTAVKPEVGRRVAALGEIGVTAAAKRETFTDLLTEAPFTPDGIAAFDKRIGQIKELSAPSKGTVAASAPATKPGSGQPTVPAGGTGETAKAGTYAF